MRNHRITALGSIIVSVLTAVTALAVNITVQPGNYGDGSALGSYVISGQGGNKTGDYTFDATLGTWYSFYLQPAFPGEFRVVDAGGGNYNVETRVSGADPSVPTGIQGSTGTASPTVSFVNEAVTIDKGVDYQGNWHVNWATNRLSDQTRTIYLPSLPSTQAYQMFIGNHPVDTWFNVGSGGFVVSTDTKVNLDGVWTSYDLGVQGGAGALTLPQAYECHVTVSGNPRGTDNPQYSWWQLDAATPSYNLQASSYEATVFIYPGNVPLVGDIGTGSWLLGDNVLNVPLDPDRLGGYTETLTRLSTMPGAPEEVYYAFEFVGVPEPSASVLLGLGCLCVAARRRRRTAR